MSESISLGASLKYSAPSWGYSPELWVLRSVAFSGSLELLAASLLLPTRLELCGFVFNFYFIFLSAFCATSSTHSLVIKIRSRQKTSQEKAFIGARGMCPYIARKSMVGFYQLQHSFLPTDLKPLVSTPIFRLSQAVCD